MGLFKFIKTQLIEVIEWLDNGSDTMVYRFPVHGQEIKMGAQLTVRESQMAVFVNEGTIADVFPPGRYKLSTQNMPVLTKIKSWMYGFDSPFKAEVYFVNTKQFPNQKWGTSNPIMMRDKDFGAIRLRGYGIYSFKVKNPVTFLKEIFGTNESFDTGKITEHLKRIIISGLSDAIAESKIPALDLAMNYDELSEAAKNKFQSKFNEMGFELSSFYIENLSLPEEVEKAMDKRTSIEALGNLNKYTQFQAAEALRDAAKNEGNPFASAGVGFGAANMMGQVMGNAMAGNDFIQNQPVSNNDNINCPSCNASVKKGIKFCPECGNAINAVNKTYCISCKAEIAENTKFCPECGAKQQKNCPNCKAEITGNTKFCPECGTRV